MVERIADILGSISPMSPFIQDGDVESFKCALLDPQGWADMATVMVCKNYSVIATAIMALQTICFGDVLKRGRVRRNVNLLEKSVNQFGIYDIVEQKSKTKNSGKSIKYNSVFITSCTTPGMTHEAFLADTKNADDLYHGLVSADPAISFRPDHLSYLVREQEQSKKQASSLESHVHQIESKEWEKYWWTRFGQFDATERIVYAPDKIKAVELRYLVERIKYLRGHKNSTVSNSEPWFVHGIQTVLNVPVPKLDGFQQISESVNIMPLLVSLRQYLFLDEKLAQKMKQMKWDDREQRLQYREKLYREKLLEEKDQKLSEDVKSLSALSIPNLVFAIKELRIPPPLSSAIVNLFIDYAKSLSDSNLFDNVLDLHEIFWATHRLITQEMLKKLYVSLENNKQNNAVLLERKKLAFLSTESLNELAAIIKLLEIALYHRIGLPFSTEEWWHSPLELRGELNHLFNSIDVVLKCGLSVLRRILKGEFCVPNETELFFPEKRKDALLAEKHDENVRSRVGGASRLTYRSGVMTRRFRIGHNEINFIQELSLNVSHLVQPGVLYTHVHETGHMIFELLTGKDGDRHMWCLRAKNDGRICDSEHCFRVLLCSDEAVKLVNIQKQAERDRYDEIFAEMFAFGLVFADYVEGEIESISDKRMTPEYDSFKTYFRHYIAGYRVDRIVTSDESRSREMLCRLAEAVTISLLATYPFTRPKRSGDPKKDLFEISEQDDYIPNEEDTKRVVELFDESLEDARSFSYELNHFMEIHEAKEYMKRHLIEAFESSYRPLCCIWEHIHRILKGEFFDYKLKFPNAGIGTNPFPVDHWHIVKDLYKGYINGQPVIRLLYSDNRADYPYPKAGGGTEEYRKKDIEKRTHLDAFFVIRHMLRFHLYQVYGKMDKNKEIYCYRDAPAGKEINEQLIDEFDDRLFSVSFEKRATYIKNRIGLIKTFWDLSTNIRGRTLRRILERVKD